MKFVVSSTDLRDQLASLNKAIKPKNTLPALDNFLFELKDKELIITASDLDTTLRTSIELENTEGSGIVGIDSKKLFNTVKGFNEPLTFNISISEEGDIDNKVNINIISANGKYSLPGIIGDEYPIIPDITNDTSITLNAETMLKAIDSTIFAAGTDESRPITTGIYFGFTEDYMVVAATDITKLVRYKRFDVKSETLSTFVLPSKPAGILRALLPKDSTPIEIALNSKMAKIKFSTITLICKLIEGTFPNFEAIIPVEKAYTLQIANFEFQKLLDRVDIYSDPATHMVKLDITANEINVSAQDLDFSISARERINCTFDGQDMAIGFKSAFLSETLSNLKKNEIKIELSDPKKAILISPNEQENENEDILMLLMPVELSE